MEVKELRVGNFVKLFLGIGDSGAAYRNFEIKGIMEQLGSEFYLINNTWVEVTNNLEPIPLTEEILLKCGFRNKGGVFKHPDCDIIQIYAHEGKFNIFVKGNKQNGSNVLGSNLHELQNLFKVLTRKELQIEL